jgi:energy-coupling factor transporter ATP-binding protein EcfA2
MRLDKFTIGSAKDSPTHQFKNLKNVTIDFDQGHWVTVVIGWNGSGKSNVLEALAIIFRDLIGKKRTPEFAFQLAYSMGSDNAMRHIHIDADPDRVKSPFIIHVASAAENKQAAHIASLLEFDNPDDMPPGNLMKLTTFLSEDEPNLPSTCLVITPVRARGCMRYSGLIWRVTTTNYVTAKTQV